MALGLPKAQHTVLLIVALVAAPVADGMIAKMKLVDPAETVTNGTYVDRVDGLDGYISFLARYTFEKNANPFYCELLLHLANSQV